MQDLEVFFQTVQVVSQLVCMFICFPVCLDSPLTLEALCSSWMAMPRHRNNGGR